MDVKLYVDIKPFIHKHLSRKLCWKVLCHFTGYPQYVHFFSQIRRRLYSSLLSPDVHVFLFLLTYQAHVPRNKQHAALHQSVHKDLSKCCNVLYWRESIDKDRTTLTVHIHNSENTLQQ